MGERLNLTVGDEVGEKMTRLAGGERSRGQWLTSLVNAMYDQELVAQGSDLEQLRFAFAGLLGQVKMLEGRLMQVERTVSTMIADRAT